MGFKALPDFTFESIDWGAVGRNFVVGLTKALAFLQSIDYGGILSMDGTATKVFATLRQAFNAIDFNAVGNQVGNAIVSALGKLAAFINRVNWNQVGQAMVDGRRDQSARLVAGWPELSAILAALVKGLIAVLKGLALLLVGIATALGAVSKVLSAATGMPAQVTAKLDNARDAVVTAANVYGNALGIGKQIVQGIANGVVLLPPLAKKLEGTSPARSRRQADCCTVPATSCSPNKPSVSRWLGIGLRLIEGIGKLDQMSRELIAMGNQLTAIANRRAAEDRAAAVRDAEAALAAARKRRKAW